MSYPTQHLAEVVAMFPKAGVDASEAIVALIERGLKAANEASQQAWEASHPDGKTNPSVSDAGKCPRAVYFSLTGVEQTEPLDTDSLVNFGIGHVAEEWLGTVLESQGVSFHREVRVEIDYDQTLVSGRIDFAFTQSGRLIELKTISSRQMGMMLRAKEAGRDNHRRQANLYLYGSKHGTLTTQEGLNLGELTEAYLVYIVKDATRREPTIHAWRVPFSTEQAEADLAQMAVIAADAKVGNDRGIPKQLAEEFRITGKANWLCQYCSYKSVCWDTTERGGIIGPKGDK